MISKAPASGFGPAGQPHEREAQLLVQLLRTSRLLLLYAADGSDKTALLTRALLPLLSRRTSDRLVPALARSSGVVVPFPDRRGRLSLRALKRRREIVVYLDGWSETPLAALREALHLATDTGPADQLAPSMRLSEILEDLGGRQDAHLIILLDRFEDFLQAKPQGAGHAQFANELVEAVNLADLPASFLIALAEGARPRLDSLRSRIPGFDDYSLKLAPPRDFKAPVAPRIVKSADAAEAADPVATDPLPVLTDTLEIPAPPSPPAPTPAPTSTSTAALAPVARVSSRREPKVPLPRLEVRTEDVYAMIEEALSRITARGAIDICLPDAAEGSAARTGTASRAQPASSPRPLTHGKDLRKAIERMEQRLGAKPGSEEH